MLYIFNRLFGFTNYPNTKAEIEEELEKGTLVKGSVVSDVFNFLKTPIIILFLILGIAIFAKTGLFTGIFSK